MNVIKQSEWDAVLRHYQHVYRSYEDMGPNAFFALKTFDSLKRRYDSGERSRELFVQMRDLQ